MMHDFDLTKTVFDSRQIMEMIPHRPPALLVDRVIEIDNAHAVGVKTLEAGMSYFNGHFPDKPVFPGALQIEAMAQVAAILCVHVKDEAASYSTILVRADEARFRREVVPGDTMVMNADLVERMPRDLYVLKCKLFVNNELASEIKIVAKVSKKV